MAIKEDEILRKNELTNVETLIMKCIWDTPEELALSQLVAMVNERFDKAWRPQTISTYLAHLVRKGFLSMRRQGKVFLYHPEVSQEKYCSEQLHDLVNYWKSPKTPMEFLEAFFDPDEADKEAQLDELEKMIDELES